MNIVGKALDELYRCFEIMNRDYFEGKLAEPVITIQKTRPNNLGHFTLDKVWKNRNEAEEGDSGKYEININPLNLNRPSENIITTLIHEMVHYDNKVKNIKDCSGQVHNKKFKTSAERVGLICEKSKTYGWGFTEPSEDFKKYIAKQIIPIDQVFEYFRSGGVLKEKKPREKKTFKYTCPSCGLVVKAERDKHIECGDCKVEVQMEEVS